MKISTDFDVFQEKFDKANKHNEKIFKEMMKTMFMLDSEMFSESASVLQILSFIHAEHNQMYGELEQLRKFYKDFKGQ